MSILVKFKNDGQIHPMLYRLHAELADTPNSAYGYHSFHQYVKEAYKAKLHWSNITRRFTSITFYDEKDYLMLMLKMS